MKRLMYVLFFVLLTSGMAYAQQAKYVFYFIGDGMGVNQVNGTEMYLAEQESLCCSLLSRLPAWRLPSLPPTL